MEKPVIILGVQGLGSIALDIFQKNNIVVYGFLDDDQELWGKTINHVPVLGSITAEEYFDLVGEQCAVFVATEQQTKQQHLLAMLYEQKKVVPINAIHPSSIIATSGAGVKLNERVFVGAGATIVAGVEIGTSASIGAGAVVLDDIKAGEVVLGNPARPFHKKS